MNLTFKDEHRPSVQTFQIVSEGRILAYSATPDFVEWLKRAELAFEIIEETQWVFEGEFTYCAICKQNQTNGHLDDCAIKRALGTPQTSGDHPPVDA